MNKDVYIVLLNYHSANHTIECLSSIHKSIYKNIYTIIVDNNSKDESIKQIIEYFEINKLDYEIKDKKNNYAKLFKSRNILIKSDENGGFAAGNNIGLDYIINNAKDGYVWILNNDTYIDKNAIGNLVKATKEDIFMGSILVDYNDRLSVQTVGGFKLNNYLGVPRKYYKGKNVNKLNIDNSKIKLDMISGASIFMTINTLKKVGLMSEEYFMYWEDTDWCYRARKKGIKLEFCKDAIVYHKEGGSIGNRSYNQMELDFKNMLYFYYKNDSKYLKVLILNKLLINIVASIKNKVNISQTIKASMKGLKEFNLMVNKDV